MNVDAITSGTKYQYHASTLVKSGEALEKSLKIKTKYFCFF